MTDPILNIHPSKDKRDWVYPRSLPNADRINFSKSRKFTTPEVRHQGSIGSCVGHSGRVVLGECSEYRHIQLSPMCIYKIAQKYDKKEGEAYEGTSVSGACKGLLKYGVCTEDLWAYGEDSGKSPECDIDANTRRIKSYYRISIKRVKEVQDILEKQCLWLSLNTHEYLLNIPKHGFIDKTKYLKSKHIGGHGMALIGYIYIGDTLYWELQNSWGINWGTNGYCYIPHSLLVKIIHGDAYVLVTKAMHDLELKRKQKEWESKSWIEKIIFLVQKFMKDRL